MHERVYHPETCEPFDVVASKASNLVLEHGWSRTPWTREAIAPEPAEEPTRGRGRRRRAAEDAAPVIEDEADDVEHVEEPAHLDDPWRS